MDDEPQVEQLENRIETLEATIEKMMPSRRDALKMGGAALAGGSLMAGTASAGTNQVGTIGTASQPVDLESEDINNADTVTTENLVVNNTATGPFGGGGGVVLEAGDTITVETLSLFTTDSSFLTLYSGVAKDVLGGIVGGHLKTDFLYTFDDSSTLRKNGTGTSYSANNTNQASDKDGTGIEFDFLPPALNVTKVEFGGQEAQNTLIAAEVILKD